MKNVRSKLFLLLAFLSMCVGVSVQNSNHVQGTESQGSLVSAQGYASSNMGAADTVPITGVSVHYNGTLFVGDTNQIIYTLSPTNANNFQITWTSSDENVLTVDENGLVTTHSPGQATVSYKVTQAGVSNYWTGELLYSVSVNDTVPMTGINVHYQGNIRPGEQEQLTYKLTPADANNETITWQSSNTEVATIDANGVVHAMNAGTTTISYVARQKNEVNYWTGHFDYTVLPAIEPTSISFSQSQVDVQPGTNQKLAVQIMPENATDLSLTWSSSNDGVASISSDGELTPISLGTTTITAITANGLSATLLVNVVNEQSLTDFTFTSDDYDMAAGQTKVMQAQVTPLHGTFASITWASDNSFVATVDSSGLVRAQAPGIAKITGTATDTFGNQFSDTHEFTVMLADVGSLPIAVNQADVVSVLTSDDIKTLLSAGGINYADVCPFTGFRFASNTIYYSIDSNLTDLVVQDGTSYAQQDLAIAAIASWNEALKNVGSTVQFVPADEDNAATLFFEEGDNTNPILVGHMGVTSDKFSYDTMLYIEPVIIRTNLDEIGTQAGYDNLLELFQHELGHALGLIHSSNVDDLMWYQDHGQSGITVGDTIGVLLNYTLPVGCNSDNTLGIAKG
ncbi:Ig-like domain-containing protein [Lacticaseibacillus pantheris]|uniref:Ig-like domain-containing protein n=1 Tax=Lacticaseibacillus pantheris TaxID=171523 RepID=UPI00265827E9|nr:Ig-like domain-containing protein [Lacticaseibacillus pantheris]WKF85972.1 Ig-like domain-containing protein [Lacticaseibacillus pantheris]